ncbi:uncharacterized protein EV154DRAFT_566270 [Mucor mucedo]|uniref:uncharacterized protein n=1 Tax=Mucor mucedo TaxID=29922 RepID=UPI00221F4027|nr:uncharacterized protein EV154DRAFT_566270 [Mucor mucedo]KAI7888512.1 hypothetical protein EV154DRAFT_566270 [Mucor mucedo]
MKSFSVITAFLLVAVCQVWASSASNGRKYAARDEVNAADDQYHEAYHHCDDWHCW